MEGNYLRRCYSYRMEYFLIKELVPKKYKSFEGLHNFNYEIVLKKKSNILFSDSYNTLEILKDENGTILFEKNQMENVVTNSSMQNV